MRYLILTWFFLVAPVISGRLCQSVCLVTSGLTSGFIVGYMVAKIKEPQSVEVYLQYVTGMVLSLIGGRLGVYRLQQIISAQLGSLIPHLDNQTGSTVLGRVVGQPVLLELEASNV